MNLINRIRQYVDELKQAYQAGIGAQVTEDLAWSEELLQVEHPDTITAWTNVDDPHLYRELEGILRKACLPPQEYELGLKGFLFTLGNIKADKVPFVRYLRKQKVH